MIGYVLPTGASVDIDPHFVEFLSGLGDYARSHELDLVLSPADADDEETTYRRVAANKQVDAVYISAPRPADRRISLVNQLGLPFLVHGRAEGLDFDYPFLDIDNEGAFHEAARLLVQLGHRRVALINGDDGRLSRSSASAASGARSPPPARAAAERIRSVAMTRRTAIARRAACSSSPSRRRRSPAPA